MGGPPLASAPGVACVAGVRGCAPAAARPPRGTAVPSTSSSRRGARGYALQCAEPPTPARSPHAARAVPHGALRGVVAPAGAAPARGRGGGEAAVVAVVHGRGEEVVLELDHGHGFGRRVAAGVAGLARAAGRRAPQVHAALVHHHHLHAAEGAPARASCRRAAAAPDLVRAGRLGGEAALVLRAAGTLVGAAALVLGAAPPIVQHAGVSSLVAMAVGVRRQELGRDAVIVTVGATARHSRLVPVVRPLPSPQTHHFTLGPSPRAARIGITEKTRPLAHSSPSLPASRASRRPLRALSRPRGM